MPKPIDFAGQRIGRLTVLSKVLKKGKTNAKTFWLCRCECGRECERSAYQLRSNPAGHTPYASCDTCLQVRCAICGEAVPPSRQRQSKTCGDEFCKGEMLNERRRMDYLVIDRAERERRNDYNRERLRRLREEFPDLYAQFRQRMGEHHTAWMGRLRENPDALADYQERVREYQNEKKRAQFLDEAQWILEKK